MPAGIPQRSHASAHQLEPRDDAGNHDWIDGLETFQRHIQHKGWIGGWLLPQVWGGGRRTGGL